MHPMVHQRWVHVGFSTDRATSQEGGPLGLQPVYLPLLHIPHHRMLQRKRTQHRGRMHGRGPLHSLLHWPLHWLLHWLRWLLYWLLSRLLVDRIAPPQLCPCPPSRRSAIGSLHQRRRWGKALKPCLRVLWGLTRL